MAEPIDSDWSNTILSDGNLNKTTYGQGTSMPSNWSTSRLFWRTDEKIIYQNVGSSGSPIWKAVGQPPQPNSAIMPNDTTSSNYTLPTTVSTTVLGKSNTHTSIIKVPTAHTSGGYGDGNNWTAQSGFNYTQVLASQTFSPAVNVTTTWTSGYHVNGTLKHQVSTDGTNWTDIHVGTQSTFTETTQSISNVTHMRIIIIRGSSGQTPYGNSTEFRLTYGQQEDVSDLETPTPWTSASVANPLIVFDMGSSTLTSAIVLYHDSTETSSSTYQIQTSDTNGSWSTKRTILVSKLTNNADNFIRFNPHSCRYIRLYASSGSISLDYFKVKKGISDSTLIHQHGHLVISSTDTTLNLDGT